MRREMEERWRRQRRHPLAREILHDEAPRIDERAADHLEWCRGTSLTRLDGTPIDVYHGTWRDFTEFGSAPSANPAPGGGRRPGHYFTTSRAYALYFGLNVYRCHLRVRAPRVVRDYDEIANLTGWEAAALRLHGFDHMVWHGSETQPDEFVVFEPDCIRIVQRLYAPAP